MRLWGGWCRSLFGGSAVLDTIITLRQQTRSLKTFFLMVSVCVRVFPGLAVVMRPLWRNLCACMCMCVFEREREAISVQLPIGSFVMPVCVQWRMRSWSFCLLSPGYRWCCACVLLFLFAAGRVSASVLTFFVPWWSHMGFTMKKKKKFPDKPRMVQIFIDKFQY